MSDRSEFGRVGYLTIHESVIEEDNRSQRRGGVHTETPGKVWLTTRDQSLSKEVSTVTGDSVLSI